MAELEAIVADYLEQAADLGRDPGRRPVLPALAELQEAER